jgi:hypothetical protein
MRAVFRLLLLLLLIQVRLRLFSRAKERSIPGWAMASWLYPSFRIGLGS